MHLERLVVLADDDAVADRVKVAAQGRQVDVLLKLADDIDGVEGEGDVAGVEFVEIRLLLDLGGGGRLGDLLALRHVEHGLQDVEPALAACVDHAGLFQNRVLLDRVGQRPGRAVNGDGQHGFKARLVDLDGLLGGNARDGQDRALGGLHHGLIRGLDAGLKRGGELTAVAFLQPLEAAREAAEQQRKNDAGVAARAAQHRRGGGVGDLRERRLVQLAQIGGGGVERHAHIRAGVAVRHREDVQLVDLLLMLLHNGRSSANHFPELRPLNFLCQFVHLPLSQ